MIPKKPKPKAGSSVQPEAESPEFAAFKELVQQVVAVPKDELDERDKPPPKRKGK